MKHYKPKIVLYDLENSPSLGWFYDPYREGNIVEDEQDWFIMSFAWKELGQKLTHCYALPDFPGYKRNKTDDRKLVMKLHEVLSSADVLVGHNSDRFDMRKANARFLVHGLDPIPAKKTIDTLKIARKHFKFNSNKLDDLGKYLEVGRKLPHTGKHLWLSCIRGDKAAWSQMKRYNVQDVVLLEDVYLKLRPWMQNHPNLSYFNRKLWACPACQSERLHKRGHYYGKGWTKERIQCLDCGKWSAGEKEKLASKTHVS